MTEDHIPARHGLLYRLLWRLQTTPRLLDNAADPDVFQVRAWSRQVRHDIHKMRAFVRFRAVIGSDGGERFVAWFEPRHHILRANAAFFRDRFAALRWSILTPRGTIVWDGQALEFGAPAQRSDAPSGDPVEQLWLQYYASTFNPARLKVGAMLKEMPRRYWQNLPEAKLIPALIAGAQARETAMVTNGGDAFADEPAPTTLADLADGIARCRRCPIGCSGTRAVVGEGPERARLMIVGEQPGDHEERLGRPFVGPAGQVLDASLAAAGIARGDIRITNAVRHFKFAVRGKVRLHQTPNAGEIDLCRWWLEHERNLVRPRTILALGASAARALLGRSISIEATRGKPIGLADGAQLWVTIHPAYLLRLDGAARTAQALRFATDLATMRESAAL